MVDHHNPGGGHWLAAGLSPQVSYQALLIFIRCSKLNNIWHNDIQWNIMQFSCCNNFFKILLILQVQNVNRCFGPNSPQIQMVSLTHGGSYGSIGSHGSYIDNFGIGSSYGSYGDANNNMQTYFSPVGPYGMNVQAQIGVPFLGTSPDTRRRPQRSHGSLFGVSPTGNLGPMSLGASPSAFTPPQMQITTVSPGKYSSSPARGSLHGSSLGKAAAVAQFNRRRASENPGISTMQLHESTAQHWHRYHNEGNVSSQPDTYSHIQFSSRSSYPSSNHSYRRQQMTDGRGSGPSINSHLPHSIHSTVNSTPLHSSVVSGDKHESISLFPDPADWDPNYRYLKPSYVDFCQMILQWQLYLLSSYSSKFSVFVQHSYQ